MYAKFILCKNLQNYVKREMKLQRLFSVYIFTCTELVDKGNQNTNKYSGNSLHNLFYP